jgi:hypothetical protein
VGRVGPGGPCHLYGGGAPPQQINTRACGQSSQENENEVSSSQSASLAPGQSTSLVPEQFPSPVPDHKMRAEVSVAQLSGLDMQESGGHATNMVGGRPNNK